MSRYVLSRLCKEICVVMGIYRCMRTVAYVHASIITDKVPVCSPYKGRSSSAHADTVGLSIDLFMGSRNYLICYNATSMAAMGSPKATVPPP